MAPDDFTWVLRVAEKGLLEALLVSRHFDIAGRYRVAFRNRRRFTPGR
jgi:hypothetical protein